MTQIRCIKKHGDSHQQDRVIPILLIIFLQTLLYACNRNAETPPPEYVNDVSGYSGRLLVSLFSNTGTPGKSSIHKTVLMNNQDHSVMEENDIRGFLDGNFKWGWNQPGQVHVRVGRRGEGAKYGEYELFRNLYRWTPPPLPRDSEVVDSSLKISIEEPSIFPLKVYLYQVNKDWNPGLGGTLNDNVSPPRDGEVWWRDLAYNQESWGLPGVNFASDTHPLADTPEMPLAIEKYMPGDMHLEFSSTRLNNYINKQISEQSPLLFLLKLSDYHEDIPGTVLTLYSGNTGDDRNTVKRPALDIHWKVGNAHVEHEYDVNLEYGRDYTFPVIPINTNHSPISIAATYIDNSNHLSPTIEYRTGSNTTVSAWNNIPYPQSIADADWVQFRIRAVHDPVLLGRPFRANLKDTWVLSASPEQQHVPWHFIAPSGKRHEVIATYKGDYIWSINFIPHETGRWKYYWENNFSHEYRSETGTFDVIIGNQQNAWRQLEAFQKRLTAFPAQDRNEAEIYMYQFTKLERSALNFLDAESYHSEVGLKFREKLNDIRGLIAEKPPEEIPLKPNPPFKWQRK